MDYDRWDALLHHIFKQTQGDAWFRPHETNISSGVAIRVSNPPPSIFLHGRRPELDPEYRIFPYETPSLEPFEAAVKRLNPVVAVKVRSAAVHAAVSQTEEDKRELYLDANTRIQLLDTIWELGGDSVNTEQGAAFLRDERTLIVWSSSLDTIIPTCQDFEDRLIKLLWRSRPTGSSQSHSFAGTDTAESVSVSGHSLLPPEQAVLNSPSTESPPSSKAAAAAAAAKPIKPTKRKPSRYAPFYNGLACALAFVFMGNGVKLLLWEFFLTAGETGLSRYLRWLLVLALPFLFCISLFFALQIIQNLSYIIGPVAQYHRNSTYYSAVAPPAPPLGTTETLPHITIHLPVYKEGLHSVIMPTVKSLKSAMRHYARLGGTSAIMIFDDGLRGISMEDRNARIDWYRQEGLGWVARPVHGAPASTPFPFFATDQGDAEKGSGKKKSKKGKSKEETFSRAGRFKKASNMNYGLELSLEMEKCLDELLATPSALGGGGGFGSSSSMHGGTPPTGDSERWYATGLGNYGIQYLNRDPNEPEVGGVPPGIDPFTFARSLRRSEFMNYTSYPGPQHNEYPPREHGSPGTPQLGLQSVSLPPMMTHADDIDLEELALNMAISGITTYADAGRGKGQTSQWVPWAANAKSLRIGELILIVDSDTIVPEDCLIDGAREFGLTNPSGPSFTSEQGAEVEEEGGKKGKKSKKSKKVTPENDDWRLAVLQHESDVMYVGDKEGGEGGGWFEAGIGYFTRRINKCISMACANGEIAPFVGHNAFLRWKALQDVMFEEKKGAGKKVWSENNVSEDFDLALRLLEKGWIVRWATYSNGRFKEGVSLTVGDELNRWMKYAFGCNEMLFNPFKDWFTKGPIHRQIRRFVWAKNVPVHYKISAMSYMFSYYAIAISWTITMINYILLGFQFDVDGFYMHSWEIWLATTVVFLGAGNVGYSVLAYRIGLASIVWGTLENIMWIPFFFFFFGGLSIPLSQSILAHLFSYDISWSATIKEVERSNFFKEIPKIAKRFWFSMGLCFAVIAGMIIVSTPLIPPEWRVGGESWSVIFPLAVVCSCHILFPIILNPWLMVFSY